MCIEGAPATLGQMREQLGRRDKVAQTALRLKLDAAMEGFYQPIVEAVVRFRYITLAGFGAFLLVVGGAFLSGLLSLRSK